jgi:hypothetical protein
MERRTHPAELDQRFTNLSSARPGLRFFDYFPTKEDMVLAWQDSFGSALAAAVAGTPRQQPFASRDGGGADLGNRRLG